MNVHTLDALSRRASLLTLGGAGIAALSKPVATVAKNTSKNKARNKIRKKAKQKCQQQVGQCTTLIIAGCGGSEECVAAQLPCCDFLATCNADGFFACIPT